MGKTYSGFTEDTKQNLLLDAGAFFKNYEIGTDTFESAVTAGKLLGASRGGGSFSAIPEIRNIEIDGVRGSAKGLRVIDSWEIKMGASIIEVSEEVIKQALISANSVLDIATSYNKVTANNAIALTDYIDNITFVGTKSGSTDPVIIQIYNAINTSGLTITTSDKGESVIELEFEGHYDSTDLDSPPFAIFYPTLP